MPVGAVGETAIDPQEALRRVQQRISLRVGNASLDSAYVPATGAPTSNPGDFDAIIEEAAKREGLDPSLVRAVVAVESGYRANAVSSAGAKGLMQLMDGTARQLGVTNSFDPVQNVNGGTKFLRHLIDQFGDERLALAAYNAGPGAVQRYNGVPPYAETQKYVRIVLAERERIQSWSA